MISELFTVYLTRYIYYYTHNSITTEFSFYKFKIIVSQKNIYYYTCAQRTGTGDSRLHNLIFIYLMLYNIYLEGTCVYLVPMGVIFIYFLLLQCELFPNFYFIGGLFTLGSKLIYINGTGCRQCYRSSLLLQSLLFIHCCRQLLPSSSSLSLSSNALVPPPSPAGDTLVDFGNASGTTSSTVNPFASILF